MPVDFDPNYKLEIILNYREPKLHTPKDLYDNAIAYLEPMDRATYGEFKEKVKIIAEKAGITKPIMCLDLIFEKDSKICHLPYQVSKHDWKTMQAYVGKLFKFMPRVFIVDGSKFGSL